MKPLAANNLTHKLNNGHKTKKLKLRSVLKTGNTGVTYNQKTLHQSISFNNQIRSLSKQRNRHKYEKMLSKSDKSEMLSNICSLEEQFDELIQQQNSRKSNSSNRTSNSYSRVYSQKLIAHKEHKEGENLKYHWNSGNKDTANFTNKQNEWTNRNGKRSLVLMNKYAPKSTINLQQQKYNKLQLDNSCSSINRFQNSAQQNTIKAMNPNQSLQVIAIGLSSSKKSQTQNSQLFGKKSCKLKLRKGIHVVSAHQFSNKQKSFDIKKSWR